MESISLATFISLFLSIGSCIRITPQHHTANEADYANFACLLNGTCPMVTWSGPILTTSAREEGRVNIHGISDKRLTISNLRSEDEGEYSCSCNGETATGYLEVNRLPSSHQNTTLTLQVGNQAIIECLADPGDPPRQITWQFNFNSLPERYVQENLHLRIGSVEMEDAGIYTCIFNGPRGHVLTNITVVVESPSEEITFVVEPSQREIVLEYTDPLNLKCEVNSATPVNVSWIVLGSNTQTSKVALEPGEVRTGLYECIAYNSMILGSYAVYVTVNAKPVFPESRRDGALIVRASEGSVLEHREMTANRAPTYGGTTTIQWRRRDSSEEVVDFGPRLQVYWNENHVTWSIRPASLKDNGQYFMNVSNEFGWTDLQTTLKVATVPKRIVYVKISGQSCATLKDHKLELARDIAGSYSFCTNTCDDSLLETGKVDCVDDTVATVSLSIPEDYYDPIVKTVTFSLGTSAEFTGIVIEAPPTTAPNLSTKDRPTTAPSDLITPLVVVMVSISIVIVLALILTVIFRKKLKCKSKETVNPEDPRSEDKGDVMCTAYVHVKQKEDVPAVPSSPVTPNGMPITPVYIPPSPTPQETSKPATERPKKLYFRSYSYSYSGRTPPDHRSRQQ